MRARLTCTATQLVRLAISEMVAKGVEEVVLETETDNVAALSFYRKLGFIKEKKLYRFYLNAKDAFRLVLPLGHEITDVVPPLPAGLGLGTVEIQAR